MPDRKKALIAGATDIAERQPNHFQPPSLTRYDDSS
jgi:hypothetical protein